MNYLQSHQKNPNAHISAMLAGKQIGWGGVKKSAGKRVGIIIACTNCSTVMTPEDLEEQEPTKEDILADLGDREYQEWKENK